MASEKRILVAGVGNVLRGDDGFGVVTAQRLIDGADFPPHVKVIETGIGGMSLVQELMDGYDALILIDACQRGGEAGQLYVLEPELPDVAAMSPDQRRDYFADTHYATPFRALAFLAAVGTLPRVIRIIGCEPADADRYDIGLDPVVERAVGRAIVETKRLVTALSEA